VITPIHVIIITWIGDNFKRKMEETSLLSTFSAFHVIIVTGIQAVRALDTLRLCHSIAELSHLHARRTNTLR